MNLNKTYWEERYDNNSIGWDLGAVSGPLKAFIDQLQDKDIKILIPGAGNGYEVEYLYQNGFRNLYVCDIAQPPLMRLREQLPELNPDRLIQQNFFELEESGFDLILEQTFFCALDPSLRQDYAGKMYSLLKKGGVLAGLFFDFPLTEKGPPFGGSKQEYEALFSKNYEIKTMERAYNSSEGRQGIELFFIFEK